MTPPPTVPTSTPTSVVSRPARSSAVLAIGDSVMEGARGSLQREMPHIAVDAVKSRQFAQAVTVLNYYAQHHALPDTIVIGLGTNGTTTPGVLDQTMRIAGDRDVFFVTDRVPRPWETAVNELIRALPDRWPNAHVIDWHDYGNAHDDWFVADGFHLTTAGQQGYATFVGSELGLLPASTTTTSPKLGAEVTIPGP